MADKKKTTTQQTEKNAADNLLITDKITIANQPLPIDPETGDIIKEELTEKQQEVLKKISSDLKQAAKVYLSKHAEFSSLRDAGKNTAQKIAELLDPALKGFSDYLSKLQTEEAREKIQAINEQLQAANKNLQPIQDLLNDLEELEPFIKEELKKEEYGGKTFDDIMEYTPGELLEKRSDPGSIIYQVFEAAHSAKADADALPQVSAQSVDNYPVTLDKINTMVVFDFLRDIDPNGQIEMRPIKEESSTATKELTSYYSLTFSDDLPPEIKRKLTPFDRLVYGAAAAVQEQNGNIMSISQIHRAMGNKKPPSKAQFNKIHDSLLRMNAAHAEIDCGEVRTEYGDGYIDWRGSLFPMEMRRAYINGQMVDGAVFILRPELPLISIAKGRHYQMKKIPTALLDSKLSQTDRNIAMEFYVLEQLLKIKSGNKKTRNKILYSTVFEKMGVKNDKNKQRAKKAFFTYLDELIEKKFIVSYQEEITPSTGETGVTFKY